MKTGKRDSKTTSTNQLRLDYSKFGVGQYCNIRELALAYEDDTFVHHLKKPYGL